MLPRVLSMIGATKRYPLAATTWCGVSCPNFIKEYEGGGMSVADGARRIVEIVERSGLRPVEPPKAPEPITEGDIGVVCYQVALPG